MSVHTDDTTGAFMPRNLILEGSSMITAEESREKDKGGYLESEDS